MREFDVGLIHHSIAHSGINLDVSQKFLHLLHGHALVYAEFLAKGYAHCGSHLDAGLDFRVCDVPENLSGVVHLGEGAHGADCHALAAEYAVGVDEVLSECGSYHSREASVNGTDGAYALVLVADGLAAAAHDTFVGVTVDGRRKLDGVL